jgi:hypothetical protein
MITNAEPNLTTLAARTRRCACGMNSDQMEFHCLNNQIDCSLRILSADISILDKNPLLRDQVRREKLVAWLLYTTWFSALFVRSTPRYITKRQAKLLEEILDQGLKGSIVLIYLPGWSLLAVSLRRRDHDHTSDHRSRAGTSCSPSLVDHAETHSFCSYHHRRGSSFKRSIPLTIHALEGLVTAYRNSSAGQSGLLSNPLRLVDASEEHDRSEDQEEASDRLRTGLLDALRWSIVRFDPDILDWLVSLDGDIVSLTAETTRST